MTIESVRTDHTARNIVFAVIGVLGLLCCGLLFLTAVFWPRSSSAASAPAAAAPPVQASAPQSAPANPPSANPAPVTGVCPTEREFEALTGVRADIVREEPCAFHWRGDPSTILAVHPCPKGWSCTLGSGGQNYVYRGDDGLAGMQIFASTWRLIDTYPAGDAVYDNCAFLKKVQNEGAISDPKWTASAGNFTCP